MNGPDRAAAGPVASGHVPVMVGEVLELLRPRPGGRYLDGTLGLGGHSRAILEETGGAAEILGLDRDAAALAIAAERLGEYAARVTLKKSPYSRFPRALAECGWTELDGALLDLGVSSLQLDSPERGFSFLREGPLDMRMDPDSGAPPASAIVNKAPFERLKDLIGRLGEEPMAGRISRRIVEARIAGRIETTAELARIVEAAYPAKWRREARNHPATRTFQALRMAVNEELEELERFLALIPEFLRPGGRVAVISFHSLEDRLVKRAFRREAAGCVCPPRQPVCTCGHAPRLSILTKRPLVPSEDEAAANPRARSAKLRAAEKLPEARP